jgi:hypothetical protein
MKKYFLLALVTVLELILLTLKTLPKQRVTAAKLQSKWSWYGFVTETIDYGNSIILMVNEICFTTNNETNH